MKLNNILPGLVVIGIVIGVILLLAPSAVAQDPTLPPGIRTIQAENQKFAVDFLAKVSFLIAFLAGVTTILSPCILPVLPAFFAYTFKQRKQLTRMTLLFFLGFTPIFILLGIAATAVGKLFAAFFLNLGFYISIAGFLLIFLGILYLFGVSFTFGQARSSPGKTPWDIFVTGALFGFGWVLCVGPVLSGVLIAASVFHNYLTATLLMVSYSLGVFVPFFLLAFFYDRYDLGNSAFMRGRTFSFSLFGERVEMHSTNLIAGTLLIATGIIFILFKGTGFLNASDPFGTKEYFYSLQDWFLANPAMVNGAGLVALLGIVAGMWYFLKKKN